MEVVHV